MNEPSAMTKEQWEDAFVNEGVRLGANADVVDSVLRQLKKRYKWDRLRYGSPVLRARSLFTPCDE